MGVDVFDTLDISIHAPREGCDLGYLGIQSSGTEFQSTHPVRGATGVWLAIPVRVRDFNPRTP